MLLRLEISPKTLFPIIFEIFLIKFKAVLTEVPPDVLLIGTLRYFLIELFTFEEIIAIQVLEKEAKEVFGQTVYLSLRRLHI